jgi:hypothetical protein
LSPGEDMVELWRSPPWKPTGRWSSVICCIALGWAIEPCKWARMRLYGSVWGARGRFCFCFFFFCFCFCGVQKKAEAFDGLKEEVEGVALLWKMETEGRFPKSLMADGRFCLFGKAVRRRGRCSGRKYRLIVRISMSVNRSDWPDNDCWYQLQSITNRQNSRN